MRLPKFTQLNKAAKRDGDAADDEGAGLDDGDEDGDDDDGWQPATAPVTPNIAETAQQLRRSLSVASLHDLAHMPPSEIRRSVGNKVWRPQDEEARIPGDWERLAVHVARGALRAGNLAFGLRATLQLVLVLIKGIRTR